MTQGLVIEAPAMTHAAIERWNIGFAVKTDAEVLSRALGPANTAMKVAGNKHVAVLSAEDTDTRSVRVTLDK